MTDASPPRFTLRQRWRRLHVSPRFLFLLFFGLFVAGGLSQAYYYWWDVRLERMLARCGGGAERHHFYPPWVRTFLGHRFVSRFEPIRRVQVGRRAGMNEPLPGDFGLLRGALFLRELIFYGPLSDDDVKHLKCLTQLTTIRCLGEPESVIDGVKDLPTLESLHIYFQGRTRSAIDGMRELARSKYLRRLEAQLSDDEFLALTNLLPDGSPPLPELREFRQFDVSPSLLTDRGLANLRNLPSLIHLDLRQSKVTDQGLAQLKELPFLRTLYLESCGNITDEGAAILATMAGLESLNVKHTSFSKEAVLRVAALPRLRQFRQPYWDTDMWAKLRQTLPVGCELDGN